MFARAQSRQAAVAQEVLSATLCIPKLVARLAVSEASLQRLHGSPGEGQPEAAQAGLPSANEARQERPASVNLGKQPHAASCHCAQSCEYAVEGQCQIGQILGLNSSGVCRVVALDACFEVLDAMLARLPMAGMPEGDVSCAQHCASMAEALRNILKGLPVSSLGAAAACIIARATLAVAMRLITQSVRLSQPSCQMKCLLYPRSMPTLRWPPLT